MLPFFNPSFAKQREKLLQSLPEGPVRDYMASDFPTPNTPIFDTPIIALDFETTGLDVNKDDLLSVGYVQMHKEQVYLGTAVHRLITTKQNIPEATAVIHGITDDDALHGGKLRAVVEDMLLAFQGKILLAHHAAIERTFLISACMNLYGHAPVLPMIDTLELARQWFDKRGLGFSPHELRLYNLRERYHLPRYHAHSALLDALATAELLLAFIEHRGNSHKMPLKEFMTKKS